MHSHVLPEACVYFTFGMNLTFMAQHLFWNWYCWATFLRIPSRYSQCLRPKCTGRKIARLLLSRFSSHDHRSRRSIMGLVVLRYRCRSGASQMRRHFQTQVKVWPWNWNDTRYARNCEEVPLYAVGPKSKSGPETETIRVMLATAKKFRCRAKANERRPKDASFWMCSKCVPRAWVFHLSVIQNAGKALEFSLCCRSTDRLREYATEPSYLWQEPRCPPAFDFVTARLWACVVQGYTKVGIHTW